jgi:hypothetical protein
MANLPQTEFPFNLPRQSSNFFFTTVPPPYQKYQLLHRLTPLSVWRVFGLVCFVFYKRLKNQDIQRVDDRFDSAINLLGSSETSARTGAVYVLHELALEEDKYRQQIVQILSKLFVLLYQ